MFSALYPAARLGLSLALCVGLFVQYSVLAVSSAAATEPLALESVTNPSALLAHHGGEGLVGASAISGASAAAAAPAIKGAVVQAVMSDSLWGNMLLSMAYQRDSQLQKLASRLKRANVLALLSITGVSGLGLAQSIYAYQNLAPQNIDVTDAHHAGGHDHVHIPAESKVPSTLGIISSGMTLGTLGLGALANHHYNRKIQQRQVAIQAHVAHVLQHLEDGGDSELVAVELNHLVGERATREFLQLWQAVHKN